MHMILDRAKMKASVEDKLSVGEIIWAAFGTVENIEGKRKKCWLPAFSFLSTHNVFKESLKPVIAW